MKVNYGSKNRNEDFLKKYPKVPAYPHFLVLDSDGKFLHSQGTGELEEKKSYNEKVFLSFLTKWQPQKKRKVTPSDAPKGKRLNAEKVLAQRNSTRQSREEKGAHSPRRTYVRLVQHTGEVSPKAPQST